MRRDECVVSESVTALMKLFVALEGESLYRICAKVCARCKGPRLDTPLILFELSMAMAIAFEANILADCGGQGLQSTPFDSSVPSSLLAMVVFASSTKVDSTESPVETTRRVRAALAAANNELTPFPTRGAELRFD